MIGNVEPNVLPLEHSWKFEIAATYLTKKRPLHTLGLDGVEALIENSDKSEIQLIKVEKMLRQFSRGFCVADCRIKSAQ